MFRPPSSRPPRSFRSFFVVVVEIDLTRSLRCWDCFLYTMLLSLPPSFLSLSLPQLIRCGNIRLAYRLLDHDANVTLTNDDGMDCIATAEEELATRRRIRQQRRCPSSFVDAGGVAGGGTTTCVDDIDVSEWTDFVDELRRRVALEKARSEARDLARSRANDE